MNKSYYDIITNQGLRTQKLCEERRRLWKAAINRKDITDEEKWDRTIVCSKHFVGGNSAIYLPVTCTAIILRSLMS